MAVAETGLPRLSEIRKHIEVLRDRLDWLTNKVIGMEASGKDPHFELREMRALLFAIPLLEAEWDTYARMHRDHQAMELRFSGAERRGDGVVKHVKEPWRPDVPYEGRRPPTTDAEFTHASG